MIILKAIILLVLGDFLYLDSIWAEVWVLISPPTEDDTCERSFEGFCSALEYKEVPGVWK